MTRAVGYSSVVEMYLEHEGARHEVAQVSHNSIILRSDPGFELTGRADLIIVVDGEKSEYAVSLGRHNSGRREFLEYQ